MKIIGMKQKELRDLAIVTIISIIFPFFHIIRQLSETLHEHFIAYTSVAFAEYCTKFVFLYLAGLLVITYRRWRNAEHKKKELEKIIASINPDVLLVVDPDRNISMCNISVHRMLGHRVEEVLNKKTDLLYFDRRSYPEAKHEIYEILENEGFHIGLATGRKKNGDVLPLEIITGTLSGKRGAVLLLRDITDRKKMEDRLLETHNELENRVKQRTEELTKTGLSLQDEINEHKRSEEELRKERQKFQSLSENTPFGMVLVGADGVFKYINPRFEEIFGYNQQTTPDGKTWFKQAYPDASYRHDVIETWLKDSKSVKSGRGITRSFSVNCNDGTKKIVKFTSVSLETGEFLITCEDITEHEIAIDALRESEERYRIAIENSNDGVAIVRGDEHLYVNKKFVEIFGYDNPEEIIGRPVSLIIHSDDREKVKEIFLIREHDEQTPERYEFRGIKKNGEALFIEVSTAIISYFGKQATLVYLRDETKRRNLEIQLSHAQKMEAIGQLAGGIAHDFNNILTALMGYGSILQLRMEQDNPLRHYVDQLLSSSQKAAKLTKSLLAFSRKEIIELKPCMLNNIIKDVEKLLARLLTEDIDLKITLSNMDLMVMADVTQVEQVLINLATNSRDAMPKGGSLNIETGHKLMDNDFISTHGYGEAGNYAHIIVSDNGHGMNDKIKDKIFDPFFTTKDASKGTGLGLSVVYGIIKQHCGYINVLSLPDQGTSFNIYLPLINLEKETEQPAPVKAKGGLETTLVAEDNIEVRKLIKEVLDENGYTVIEAGDGVEAIKKSVEHEGKIDLYILDVVMPRMNGKEVYDEIRKTKPDMKALFVSGYTGDVVIDKGIYDDTVDFISKPLLPNELLLKIRDVLDK